MRSPNGNARLNGQLPLWQAYADDHDNVELRNALVVLNKDLVNWVFGRIGPIIKPSECSTQDILQEGRIALVRAVERFDLSRGYKFSTYAVNCIRDVMIKKAVDTDAHAHIPVNYHHVGAQIHQAEAYFCAKFGRFAKNDAELSEFLGCEANVVSLLRDIFRVKHMASTDIAVGDSVRGKSDSDRLVDILPSAGGDDPCSLVLQRTDELCLFVDYSPELRKAWDSLPLRSRLILKMSAEHISNADIGRRIGISRERVRQLRDEGILMMRRRLGVDPDPLINLSGGNESRDDQKPSGESECGIVELITDFGERVRKLTGPPRKRLSCRSAFHGRALASA